jgi:predicted SnoaL-like aldol condensation-catalyzing enzyme
MALGNKEIALTVLKGAFIDRDPGVVEKFFAPTYTQHNPAIPDGPAPIPGLIASLAKDFSYEPGMAVAEGDLVMVHGRYVGWGPKPMIASTSSAWRTERSPSTGTSCRRKCRLRRPRAAIRCSAPWRRNRVWAERFGLAVPRRLLAMGQLGIIGDTLIIGLSVTLYSIPNSNPASPIGRPWPSRWFSGRGSHGRWKIAAAIVGFRDSVKRHRNPVIRIP